MVATVQVISGSIFQRVRRRCRPRKVTLAWVLRFLFGVVGLLLIYGYVGWTAVKPKPVPGRCRFPELDINHPGILRHFGLAVPLNCGGSQAYDWVCVRGSSAALCNGTADRHPGPITCQYEFLDSLGATLDREVVEGLGAVQLKSDMFNVRCVTKSENGLEVTWKSKMAGVVPRPEALARKDSLTDDQISGLMANTNVLVWDFGSMSRLTFIRKLPKTYAYIVEVLRGFGFTGYNSMGLEGQEGLLAILGGEGSDTDQSEFVWSAYKRRGYVTALAIDGADDSLSSAADVDHHLGPLYKHFVEEGAQHKPFCYGGKPRHEVVMDLVMDFFDAYPTNPKLAIVANRELTNNRVAELADEDNVKFLMAMRDKKHLDNTVLIVLSDSGPRKGSYGASQQARLEEQLPFLAVIIPLSFETGFPESSISLHANIARLVTQLDIHATLVNFLDLTDGAMGRRSQRAISLLAEIPGHRSCEEAAIPASACTCLRMAKVSTRGSLVQTAAGQLVDMMNAHTEPHRSVCPQLQLVQVESSQKFVPNSELLRGRNIPRWVQRLMAAFSDVHFAEEELYHVTLVVSPGQWKYGAYVRYTADTDKATFDPRWIYRNTDSDKKDCLPKGASDELRVLCLCDETGSRSH